MQVLCKFFVRTEGQRELYENHRWPFLSSCQTWSICGKYLQMHSGLFWLHSLQCNFSTYLKHHSFRNFILDPLLGLLKLKRLMSYFFRGKTNSCWMCFSGEVKLMLTILSAFKKILCDTNGWR